MVDNGRNDGNYAEIGATKYFNILDAPIFNVKGYHP